MRSLIIEYLGNTDKNTTHKTLGKYLQMAHMLYKTKAVLALLCFNYITPIVSLAVLITSEKAVQRLCCCLIMSQLTRAMTVPVFKLDTCSEPGLVQGPSASSYFGKAC